MVRRRVIGAALVCLLGIGTVAGAQDSGRVGITMGYPASIGILWHVSERVALRPEFSFTTMDSSSASLIGAESSFSSTGTGISALFSSPARDNLRLYVAPRFQYARTHGDSDTTESTTNSYTFAGMFGAQYALGRRFAAFGEVGLGYARQSGSLLTSVVVATRTTSKSNTFGTRTGIGVVLYFR